MNCKQAKEFLSALVDNEEIDSQTQKELNEHIQKCKSCKLDLEIEKKIKQAIRTKVRKISVPNELIETILTQIKSSQVPHTKITQISSHPPKPIIEIAFSLGVLIIILSLAIWFVSVYEYKTKQREIVIREISHLVYHFDSVTKGFIKPEILAYDPKTVQNELTSKLNFKPIFMQIPDYKIVGASLENPHSDSKGSNCINIIYRSQREDKFILFHQAPIKTAPIHEDLKARILKGEKIYDTIGDDSFAIWGMGNLICCAISNTDKKELEKILNQSK